MGNVKRKPHKSESNTSGAVFVPAKFQAALAAASVRNPFSRPPLIAPSAYATGVRVGVGEARTSSGSVYLCTKTITTTATAPTVTGTQEAADGSGRWMYWGPAITSDPLAPAVTVGTTAPAGVTKSIAPATALGDACVKTLGVPETGLSGIIVRPTIGSTAGTSGSAFLFETPSAKVAIKTFYAQPLRIRVGDRHLSPGALLCGVDGSNPGYTLLDFSAKAKESRSFRLEFIGGATQNPIQDILILPESQAWKPRSPNSVSVLFMGCSYEQSTNGPDVSAPGLGYVQIAAAALGWDESVSAGFGGSGYITPNGSASNLPSARIPLETSGYGWDGVVFGQWATNDPAGQEAAITAAVTAAVLQFRSLNPGVPLWVMGVTPRPDTTPAQAATREQAVASGVAAAGGGYVDAGMAYPGGDKLTWFVRHSTDSTGGPINALGAPNPNTAASLFFGTNIHPNDKGHQVIGEFVARQISATFASLL